ncbi:MAG: hypothetical protein RLZZ347_192 [Candidatus Parcubacteria bacterium]|jgi:hypothetical protein
MCNLYCGTVEIKPRVLLKNKISWKGTQMNSIGHRLISCASIGAIFTLLALAFRANHVLVVLAFIFGTACAWVSADLKGFALAVKDRLAIMRAELMKKKTRYEKHMQKLTRYQIRLFILFFGVWFGQSAVFATLWYYVLYSRILELGSKADMTTTHCVFIMASMIISYLWVLSNDLSGTIGTISDREKVWRSIKHLKLATNLLLSHGWVVFYALKVIGLLAWILESVPKVISWFWGHFVALLKSAHTDERLVYSVSVALGMLAGFYVGVRTESLAFGTCVGGVGGAVFAWLDWYVFSVWLYLRENPPIPPRH